jgi:hypothetical protein
MAKRGQISLQRQAQAAEWVAWGMEVAPVHHLSMTRPNQPFRLAAACCRWPPSPAREFEVCSKAAGVSWVHFLGVIDRQRVDGLAADGLRRAAVPMPEAISAELDRTAQAIARVNLAFAAESRRLQRMLSEAAIPHLFVKGASLDMLAYGTLALKRARDIDLLVAPEAARQACALMRDAGYLRIAPGPEIGDDRLGAWLNHCKETNWRHERTGLFVEIHTQLVDNPALLPGIDAYAPSQLVEIAPGIQLPTLRTDELFAYLCVHGATHAWSRLKWIADLGAFLSHFDPAEIERLYRTSLRLGVGRCSAQALLLCADLFDTPVPGSLLIELRSDRTARKLARTALSVMSGETELDKTVLGTLPIHLSHFALAPGWRYKVAEARRKLASPHDRASIDLPRPLRFLYPLLAVPSWVRRRIRGPASL